MKQLSFRARSFIFNNKKNDKVSYMTQLGQSKATSQIVLKNIYSGEGYLQVGRATCYSALYSGCVSGHHGPCQETKAEVFARRFKEVKMR